MPTSRRTPVRDLALVASFAALIAVLGLPGQLTLLGNGVPITLQSLGVMLAGSVLGARRGFLAVLTFLALVAVGLPLLSGGRGGLGVFVGASAGYLVGFPVGAAVTGWLVQRRLPVYPVWLGLLANVVGGMVVVYAIGIPVQAQVLGLGLWTAVVQAAIFLPGDVVKAVVATVVAAGVHRGRPVDPPSRARSGSRDRARSGSRGAAG